MTGDEPRRDILFVYADGRTLSTDCAREIIPVPILEQLEIDPLEEYVRITHFRRTTPEQEEPMIYEEFKSELKCLLEGNAEAIRRIQALRR